jgi:hypothetical protein
VSDAGEEGHCIGILLPIGQQLPAKLLGLVVLAGAEALLGLLEELSSLRNGHRP